MRITFLAGALAASVIVSGNAALAQALFSKCNPMSVRVSIIGDKAANRLRISKASVQVLVESRLRSASLYDSTSDDQLSISLMIFAAEAPGIKPIFPSFIALQYWMLMRHPHVSDVMQQAVIHHIHAGNLNPNRTEILSMISEMMDKFLVDYLRDNEKSCARNRRTPADMSTPRK